MVQAGALLLEHCTGIFGRRRADRDRRACADAIADFVSIDDRLHAEKRLICHRATLQVGR